MQLHLIFCAIFCLSTITFVKCKTYDFTGSGWKNEIRKCASGGGDDHSYVFAIGTLDSVGLKYEDINAHSLITAYGDLKGHTGAVDNAIPSLQLKNFQDGTNYKKFYGDWGYKATAGWATQIVKIQLTVKFLNNGQVQLYNYVYAGSWMAVTCAETTSYVNKVEIINN